MKEENKEIKTKVCSKCKKELPATIEYFHKAKKGKYGLNKYCKECRKEIRRDLNERKLSENFKQCEQCLKVLEISNFTNGSNYCSECSGNIKINETKECIKCHREFPKTLEYFHKDKYNKDGYCSSCKECRTGKEIFNKKEIKEGYRLCIKCNRELPSNIQYFPPDKLCKGGLRNVCRECGKEGHFMKDGYIPKTWWTAEDNELLKRIYPDYTNLEIIELFFPNETLKSLADKAFKLGKINKTDETMARVNKEKSQNYSGINSWSYGKKKTEEQKKKQSEMMKYKFAQGIIVSPLKNRIVSDEERKRMSERSKGRWAGNKNPRHLKPLNGELNGRWEGGKKQIYFDLRDHIKEWKKESMSLCNYKCVITGDKFHNIHHLYPFRKIVDESI